MPRLADQLRRILDTMAEGFQILDRRWRYVYLNRQAAEHGQRPIDQYVGRTIMECYPGFENTPVFAVMQRCMETGTTEQMENEFRYPDGRVGWFELRIFPVSEGIGILSIDITPRKRAELALRRSEELFEKVFRTNPVGIAITRLADVTFVDVNDAYLDLIEHSREEVIGHTSLELGLLPPDERAQILHQFQQEGHVRGLELDLHTKSGKLRHVILLMEPIELQGEPHILTMTVDMTIQRSLERQVREAQRMESLGTIASGIAHDFNNLLGIIIGHTHYLPRIDRGEEAFQRAVDAIRTAADRGATLVRQLLTFAQRTDSSFEIVRLNDVVREVASLILQTFPKTIAIEQRLHDHLPWIAADSGQIHQVLLNLCINARDAMPDGGTLTITTRVISGTRLRERHSPADASEYVEVEVRDTGTGMNPDVKEKIFEPFFTTKGPGKGTGLGLAVVTGIIKSHRGIIDVESEPGSGTAFHIYFPIKELMRQPPEPVVQKTREAAGGSETILLVEDETLLREMAKLVLVSKGYTVLTANDGEGAIEVYERHRAAISLVLTDLGLPKVNGPEVVRRLHELNPSLRILVATGFLEPEIRSQLSALGVIDVIQKPYSPEDIEHKVRNALDEE
jgi:PAS domain S-box-containing protein